MTLVWHWLVTLSIYIRLSLKLSVEAMVSVFLRVFFWFNPTQKAHFTEVMNDLGRLNTSKLHPEDWQDQFFTWPQLKQVAKRALLDFYKTAHQDGPAVDVDVITLDGKKARLLDYSKDHERPLVINFGSCT